MYVCVCVLFCFDQPNEGVISLSENGILKIVIIFPPCFDAIFGMFLVVKHQFKTDVIYQTHTSIFFWSKSPFSRSEPQGFSPVEPFVWGVCVMARAGNSAMVHGFGCRAGVSGDWTRVLWGNGPGIFAIGPQRIAQISRGYKVSKIVGVVCLAKKLQKMLDFCTCPCSISSFLFFQPKARNSFLSHPKVWELTTKASLPVVSLPAMCWAQS